jgi:hypothetical protein
MGHLTTTEDGTSVATGTSMRTLWSFVALAACAACSGQLIPSDDRVAGGPDGRQSTGTAYRPSVQQDLEAAGCLLGACHGTASAAVPMTVTAAPTSEDQWMSNYDEVRDRAGSPASSPLIDKALGDGGHLASLSPSDPILARWEAWIAAGAPYRDTVVELDGGVASQDAGPTADAPAAPGLTWDRDIDPLLARNGCRDCHGPQNVQGAYSLDTYEAAFGFGTDGIPNILPGDGTSLLAQYCEQGHEGIGFADAVIVVEWIIDWDARR